MIGSTLSHYRIVDKLGAGGMGEVYRAEDTRLKRQVALKVLPAEMASSQERLERFRREAETLAALDHPNIVTIYSVEDADGVHFLTMQLVEGESLSQRVRAGGLPLSEIFDLAIPLAEALTAAHEQGIVHRDLKPANVMVSTEGRVKVLDFGLAKPTPEAGKAIETELPTEALTQEGAVVGTVPYMSPEQLQGRPVDARSDLFSLGVILYGMATGRHPFKGDTSATLVSAILRDTPAEVDLLRGELPHDLARIIRRCLEKDPEQRIQSAKDVRNELVDLRREIDSGSRPTVHVAATPPSSALPAGSSPGDSPPAGSEQGRPRWIVPALAGLVIIMALVALFALTARDPEPEATADTAGPAAIEIPRIVVLPFENLGPPEDAYFAAGITEEITSRLAMVRGLQVISRNSAVQYAGTGKTTEEIGSELSVQYLLEGTVRWASSRNAESRVRITPQLIRVADDSHLWAQSYERVVDDIFAIQSEIAAQVVDRLDVTLLDQDSEAVQARPTDNPKAYQAYLLARGVLTVDGASVCRNTEQRQGHLEAAVALDPNFSLAWADLARNWTFYYAHCTDGMPVQSAPAREALARAEALAPNSWPVVRAKVRFAQRIDRDYEQALEYLQAASAQVENDADMVHTRGTVLRRMGRWTAAIADFKRASELDPRNATATLRIASAYTYLRRYAEADEYFERTIRIDPDASWPYQRKAWNFWLWNGDLAAARMALELYPGEPTDLIRWAWFWQGVYEGRTDAALERLAATPGEWIETDLDINPKALLAAQLWDIVGETARAQTAYEEALGMLEDRFPEVGRNSKALRAMGLTLAGLGRGDEAISHSRRSVALYPVETDPYFGSTDLLRMALIYTRLGRIDEALDVVEQLLGMPSLLSVALLELDPRWRPLREHPRYESVVLKFR